MDLTPIILELDQEIEKLMRVRKIVAGLSRAGQPMTRPKLTQSPAVPAAIKEPEPRILILPPKQSANTTVGRSQLHRCRGRLLRRSLLSQRSFHVQA